MGKTNMSDLIGGGEDFEHITIQAEEETILDKELTITDIKIGMGSPEYGEYAIVTTKNADVPVFRTSSEVLVKQLKEGLKALQKGDTLVGTIKRPEGKRYYTF